MVDSHPPRDHHDLSLDHVADGHAQHLSLANGSQVCASDALLRLPPTKSRVALVCLVWGEAFADFFARYCIPSLLAPRNIPLAAREQELTLLLYTDRATHEFLERCDSFKSLCELAKVEVFPLERLPAGARTNHWVPWQHAVASRTRDFDYFLIIIPDCVYAAGCLGTIIAALKDHDTVYYTIPQVCKETVAVELDRLRRVEDHAYISFTPIEAVELFIRHVNPKHAAAACAGAYFINHPEYAIQLATDRMVISETGSHPFAVRSSTRAVSYILDALTPGAKVRHLEILGVSAEPTFKFVEQYFRWPKLHREYSWSMNLGVWAWNFRDANASAYAKSATHIALDRGRVLEQHRGGVPRAKTRFLNATLDFLAVAMRIHGCAREMPNEAVAKYIALAITAPGFQRCLRKLGSEFTVVLPTAESRFWEVAKRIEAHPCAQQVLWRFLMLHVVVGRIAIVPGHAIFLTYSDAADDFAKAFVVDPNSVALGAGVRGRLLSRLQWVWEKAFCVQADVDYGALTWSMLDPRGRAPELVLDPPAKPPQGEALQSAVSKAIIPVDLPRTDRGDSDGTLARQAPSIVLGARGVAKLRAVRVYRTAAKLPLLAQSAWLARNLYRQHRGRSWLSLEDAGISPVSRVAWLGARRSLETAGTIHQASSPSEPELLVSHPALSKGARDSYDAISKLNIVETVAKVMRTFYEGLGVPPQQSPAYRCLASMRSELTKEVETHGAASAACALERFELAWGAYEAGATDEALQSFREVVADERLAKASENDPRAREAFIRAAETLGRHAELGGDAGTAAQLYRRILKFEGNGIVARRLLLMLWRDGQIQEAAEIAPRVLTSDLNLARHLLGSDTVKDLTRWFGREARQEPTMVRGQNARDFGLQAG